MGSIVCPRLQYVVVAYLMDQCYTKSDIPRQPEKWLVSHMYTTAILERLGMETLGVDLKSVYFAHPEIQHVPQILVSNGRAESWRVYTLIVEVPFWVDKCLVFLGSQLNTGNADMKAGEVESQDC
jgi:hypothetical protein